MKLKICTVYYNQWDYDPKTGVVYPNDPPLPIERSIAALKKKFDFVWQRVRATYIAWGRNVLVSQDRNEEVKQTVAEDFDFYLYVDSDVDGFEFGQVEKLLSYNLPIVSGAYIDRKDQECFCAGGFPDPPKHRGEFVKCSTKGLIPVDWVGAGFLLIRRDVFETLSFPWFEFTQFPYKGENGASCVMPEAEDISFCRKARDAGYEIYLDCDCQVNHNISQTKGAKRMDKAQQPQQINISDWQVKMLELNTEVAGGISWICGQVRQLVAAQEQAAVKIRELTALQQKATPAVEAPAAPETPTDKTE